MRKGLVQATNKAEELTVKALEILQQRGFRYVQIKGLTIDKHFEYVEPYFMMLIPMKELPTDPMKRDIYEPTDSALLYQWAKEKNEYPQILIAAC